jgi:hypothetical protein
MYRRMLDAILGVQLHQIDFVATDAGVSFGCFAGENNRRLFAVNLLGVQSRHLVDRIDDESVWL